jgi:tripartite-type tricarboxylate transporter receptor subunit TctC
MRTLLLSLLLCASIQALGQPYPSRPVRMVIPLSPGGFADVPGRMLAQRLAAGLGYNVFVDNRPGAGGTIGSDFVAKSAPDGYTLLLTGTPHLISAHLYKKLPYDSLKDFTPIALFASGPYALVVNPRKVPVNSVRELIATAKAEPGKIDYASSGNGGAQHLVGALFNSLAGVQLNHVPYKGSGPAMQDLISGQVGVSFAGIPNVLGQAKAGRLRILAVTSAKRWSELPDVPTLAEAGVPGYDATLWLDILGPAGMPAELVQRLASETARALQDPELQASFRSAGVEANFMGPQELAPFLEAEYDKWGRLVRETGATVN